MSMMVSFVLSFFPRDVLDEILNLIESVSEDFPSYSLILAATLLTHDFEMTSYCDVIMSNLSQHDVISTLFGSWTVAVNYLPFLVYSRRKK